jgi:hypothetical protein
MMNNIAVALIVPVELQRRGFQNQQIFKDLANRSFETKGPSTIQQIQPWCRWQGLSQYLDCLAFADRSAKELPTGNSLSIVHVTPGRFYSVSLIFITQALIDNIAVWLCDAMKLSVKGGARNFFSSSFKEQIIGKYPTATAEFAKHEAFIKEINNYRQIWIHTISGGAIPFSNITSVRL